MTITNIRFGGVYEDDYPDYCDAYIVSANKDGIPMSEEKLDELNKDSNFVHNQLIKYLH